MKRGISQRLVISSTINIHSFATFAFASTAWAIWPGSPEWWGLAVISILLALAALQSLKVAIAKMIQVYEQDRAIAEFEAIGGEAKSSDIASLDQLRRAGMLDG